MAKKILLADDSITIQKVISITFASEDYEIVVVGDGDSAIAKAKDITPDLVMADVAMPGKNGYEVCEVIKNDPDLGNTPVLLLAGTFEPLNKAEAERVRADDSIVKPFESQELVDKVKELLRKAETAQVKPKAQEAVAAQSAASLEVSEGGIWEAGDFLGFSEEAAKTDFKESSADLGFLEEGLFEPNSDMHLTEEHGFVDLDFKEEEAKPAASKAPDFELETFDRGAGPAQAEKRPEQKKEEDPFSFDSSAFDSFKPEPFKSEPFEVGPFDVEAFKEAEPAKEDFWATPAAVDKKEPEPDIIEMPQEEIIPEPQKIELAEEPVFQAEPEKPVAPVFEIRPEPPRETISAEAVARASEAKVSELIEKAAAKVEERIREVSLVLEKAEAQMNRAIQSVQSMAEENLKTGLNASFQKADVQISKMMETVASRAEQKVREEMNSRLDKLTPPRALVEDIIRKSTKEIVEQAVWEVVPELAENIIKAEIAKFKEAIAKLK